MQHTKHVEPVKAEMPQRKLVTPVLPKTANITAKPVSQKPKMMLPPVKNKAPVKEPEPNPLKPSAAEKQQ